MDSQQRATYLSLALRVFGVVFVVGVPLLMMIWPDGFGWKPYQPEYEQMIMGIYVVLGIFLFRAASNPAEHTSLIWFAIWSSLLHSLTMAGQALLDPIETTNFIGDIPALILVAVMLAWLMPKSSD